MIYVGTCGYAYKDWIGAFYPGTIRKEEMLAYYASIFCAVEIDASFYGILQPATVARLISRTPDRFRFCLKAPQTVTHTPDPAAAHLHPDARAFVESVLPIRESGKMGAALLQFPNGFRAGDSSVAYLRRVAAAMRELPLVAEFRNHEWQTPGTHELLEELGVGWCNVDMPSYETLMRPSSDVTASVGYVRFHGRNAQQWWTGNNTTRYDYLYTAQELEPWCDRTAEIADKVEQTYAFFNNHARGNATRNAEMFADLLQARYGEAAASIVRPRARPPSQGTLFD